MVLNSATHTVTLLNAGHPSPLLTCHTTSAVEEAAPAAVAGPPIGIEDGYRYGICQIQLLPGDGLFLFSDGVIDALNPQDHRFGMDGIRAVLQSEKGPRHETGERLIQAVKRHASGCSQNDDIALVCFGRSCVTPPSRS